MVYHIWLLASIFRGDKNELLLKFDQKRNNCRFLGRKKTKNCRSSGKVFFDCFLRKSHLIAKKDF